VVLHELGVVDAHDLDHRVDHAAHNRGSDAEDVGVTNGAAKDATQHIATRFVRRKHAIGHQHRGGTSVISKNPQRHELLGFHGREIEAGEARGRCLQRAQLVGVPDGIDALHDGHRAFEAHAGVDRRFR